MSTVHIIYNITWVKRGLPRPSLVLALDPEQGSGFCCFRSWTSTFVKRNVLVENIYRGRWCHHRPETQWHRDPTREQRLEGRRERSLGTCWFMLQNPNSFPTFFNIICKYPTSDQDLPRPSSLKAYEQQVGDWTGKTSTYHCWVEGCQVKSEYQDESAALVTPPPLQQQ